MNPTDSANNWFNDLRAAWEGREHAIAIEQVVSAAREAPTLNYRWADLDAGSGRIANLFARIGLERGERVAVQVDKSVEALMLYLACLRAGLVMVPLNSAYQTAEMASFIEDAEPAVLVCAPARFAALSSVAFQAGVGHVYTLGDAREGTLLERAAFEADEQAPVAVSASDVAALIYTSGTTGRSKGAQLTHANLRANALTLLDHWDWRSNDVLLHALPIFHVHGLFVAIHCALLGASRMRWFNRFDASQMAAQLPAATVFMGVPTMYTRLLAEPALTPAACARMRLFISGSAPLLAETLAAFAQRSGHIILERYGMSETLMITSNPCRAADGERRAGTVGRALPGMAVRVVNAEGQPCAAGEVGAVQTRGPSVCSGYWRRPAASAEAFTADGWFDTGDVGHLDAEGVLTLVGRSKDVIISGGFNIYPAEIEGVINALPGVAESAVVAMPHADFGEAVAAFVVPEAGARLNEAALLALLKGQIAGFKLPRHVALVDELPRNAMGKVQKKLLRERLGEVGAAAR